MATAYSYNIIEQNESMNPSARMMSNIEEGLCDWKFRIYQDSDCNGDFPEPYLALYFDAYFNPLDYDENSDEEDNGFGELVLERKIITRVANFDLIADQVMTEYLYQMSCKTNLRLHARESDEVFEIIKMDIERKGVVEGYLIDQQIRFTFRHDDFDALGLISCCRPALTDPPFEDDCPDNPGGSGECGDFAVEVTRSGDDLTATPTDAPGATSTNWLYRETLNDPWELLVTDASSIALGEYGIYKAVTTSEGCSVDDSYLYQDPCSLLSVEIQDAGAGLVAVGSGCDTPIYTWFLWDPDLMTWTEVYDGGPSFVPSVAGTYRVEYSGCDTCVAEDVHEWTGETECEVTTSLVYNDGILSVLFEPCGEGETNTKSWTLDTGDGPEVIQSGPTANTWNVTEPGLYEVTVTCSGGCVGYARHVITCIEGCVLDLSVAVEGDIATATVDGCEDDIEFTWYRNSGSGSQEAGTGNPFDLPGVGLYRLHVVCGDCEKDIEFLHCPSADNTCQQSQYFTDFVGTVLTITAFDLPNPLDVTEKYIRDNLWVFRQNTKQSYNIGFTIDYENAQIILSWDAEGEFIEVYWLGGCS